jgi:S-adenosylmethionine synthetase
VFVNTFGTGRVPDARLERAVQEVFDLRPGRLIADLKLRRPIYSPTAAYGHFGREPMRCDYQDRSQRASRIDCFTWERTDRLSELRSAVKA